MAKTKVAATKSIAVRGRRPRTGEPRKTKQPLLIDRLPVVVQEQILFLHNARGKSFETIEAYSAEPVSKDTLGFIEWDKLDPEVLALFPERRLSRSTLHRWHDLRFVQAKRDIYQRSEMAREIAEAFAKSVVTGGDEAVIAAARDTFMVALTEDPTSIGRQRAAKALIALAEVMQGARANDIKERKVAADERKLQLLEEREKLAIQKLQRETERLAKKARSGQPITDKELLAVRERTFGF